MNPPNANQNHPSDGTPVRTPVTLVSGPLGSGKTTLLRHILDTIEKKIAIVMNEFGEIGIDGQILSGRNVQISELDGGCVCCSLLGEFEAAVDEILETVDPEWVVVETTGVAEPDALASDIQDSLPQLRLDGVVVVMDADAMLAFPDIGHTTRLQVESADTILLNKVDLVESEQLPELESKLREINSRAEIVPTTRCRTDPGLLLGLAGDRRVERPRHRHQSEYQAFSYEPRGSLDRACFEELASRLSPEIFRAKGFVTLDDEPVLFNFVAGRWEFESFKSDDSGLVFIGREAMSVRDKIEAKLGECESGRKDD